MNARPVTREGAFVLYWMIAARRAASNYALDRALEWCRELGRPLVVLEALRCDYPYASDRLHRFVFGGMLDNKRAFAGTAVQYIPYVEPAPGAGRGLIEAASAQACVVVTDEFPGFFLPAAVEAAGRRVTVRLEAVDSNGLIPLRASPRAYPAAVHFRRFMQGVLREHVVAEPNPAPGFSGLASARSVQLEWQERWAPASDELLAGSPAALGALPIDHSVGVVDMPGGTTAARASLASFVARRLTDYAEAHNHPDVAGTSRLSPYLHFGHLSAHQVFKAVMAHERWNIGRLGPKPTGGREGWWGVGPSAEAFLDQLVVWRELGYGFAHHRPDDYNRFEGLPGWAQETLEAHSRDPRPVVYDFRRLEEADTHDPVWNAAQREMVRDGWMHNYMRMLWGKKILEWSPSPRVAFDTMVRLMDRWSVDGRDPNSYSGYAWTLGRFDRPWPERPIFGTIRYMSSDSALKKLKLKAYLAANAGGLFG
ncbi:MAG: hypothetical protein U0Q55_23660 [Vicinamibacterales bacterium]